MILSIIVAAAENNVIGRNNELIWHISADLKRFKQLTLNHPVIMGRKTFESIGRPLPKRRNIVISRNADFRAPGCEVADSIEAALEITRMEEEVFVIGGDSVYRQLWQQADRLYLTRVHAVVEGDSFIPPVNPDLWTEKAREDFQAEEAGEWGYSFIDYVRAGGREEM